MSKTKIIRIPLKKRMEKIKMHELQLNVLKVYLYNYLLGLSILSGEKHYISNHDWIMHSMKDGETAGLSEFISHLGQLSPAQESNILYSLLIEPFATIGYFERSGE